MVADIEQLEEMDASEIHARRLNAKEVLTPQRSGNFTEFRGRVFVRRTRRARVLSGTVAFLVSSPLCAG